jgi:hypothetical protein
MKTYKHKIKTNNSHKLFKDLNNAKISQNIINNY